MARKINMKQIFVKCDSCNQKSFTANDDVCFGAEFANKLFLFECNSCKNIGVFDINRKQLILDDFPVLYPKTIYACWPHNYLQNDLKRIFNEAKRIVYESPRAALVMLRLIVETIIKRKFKLANSAEPLSWIIKKLAKQKILNKEQIEFITVLKNFSNEAAHQLNVKFSLEDVKSYFNCVNDLVVFFHNFNNYVD